MPISKRDTKPNFSCENLLSLSEHLGEVFPLIDASVENPFWATNNLFPEASTKLESRVVLHDQIRPEMFFPLIFLGLAFEHVAFNH